MDTGDRNAVIAALVFVVACVLLLWAGLSHTFENISTYQENDSCVEYVHRTHGFNEMTITRSCELKDGS